MKNVHLVITDLFLPKDIVSEVCADLHLPALEKMLARGASTKPLVLSSVEGSARTGEGGSLENLLCELFGVPCQTSVPIAPISAAFDGLGEGCWLRADPVHLRLQREQLVLLPDVAISADEAAQMCASLNLHFAGQGMEFFAPHPQRWYLKLDRVPNIETVPLSQVAGRNVHGLLPKGGEAMRWHQSFNEIQMLLFAHPVNEAREARGELPVNSVWLWGGGCTENLLPQKAYDCASSDEVLAEMFAAAAGIPFAGWPEQWNGSLTLALSQREREFSSDGRQLLVWSGLRAALQRGDLAAWRDALQGFETGYAQPLWQALRSGRIAQLQTDILGGDGGRRVSLTRGDAWACWRRTKPLEKYSQA
ncbi:MAG: hypothetical protein K2P67_00010 [Gallionellaceae bacterium]|nr:hypothetical protein [Gallionellaceae bacterium]